MLRLAILLALTGTFLLFDAEPGINWGIWATMFAGGLLAVQWAQFGRVGRTTAGLALLGCAFAWGPAISASEPVVVFDLLAMLLTFAIAVLALPDDRAVHLTIGRMVTAPLRAPIAGTLEAGSRLQEAVIAARREEALPVLRGVLIAVPLVGGFGLALSAADPVFASWRDGVARSIDHLPVGRVVFGLVLFVACVGALGIAARGARRPEWKFVENIPIGLRLGTTERLIPIASTVALFACFLVLQASYLFGNAPAVAGSGITFAEYARRGFAEITVVTMLCGALLVLLRGNDERRGDARVLRALELTLVAELAMLLASAFRRILLYEEAYGYTVSRVWGQAFMVTLALGLGVLALELAGRFDAHRLVRRQASLGAAMLLALTAWNHEAWITHRNVERFEHSGQLDLTYISRTLSASAMPAALEAARRAGGVHGICADLHIRERWARTATYVRGWHEWNAARHVARVALGKPVWYELPEGERVRLLGGGCGKDWSVG